VNELDTSIQQIISRVKHLEIRARKLVEDSLSSEYHSVFKGRGIEFNEVRNYLPEDDVRDIDWNVTARMNEPYIKTYIEERQLTVIFAVDVSASSYFGSGKSKREVMAEVAALLGFASFFNHDKAGLFLFSDDVEKAISPRRDYSHLLRIIRDVWYYEPLKRSTNLESSFRNMLNMLKKKAIIFILSDFLDTNYEKPLLGLSRKHEVIPIVVHDSMEQHLRRPSLKGWRNNIWKTLPILADLEDMELKTTETISLSGKTASEIYRFQNYYRKLFKKLGLDYAEINNQIDYFKTIELLLRKRMKKR
jgi:uncharacterized protein (DUF58 family)